MVKCTKLYSGYYGCDKCCQRGKYVGRMTYPVMQNLPLRTDTAFRNKTQEGHHRGVSPFLQLHNLDIILTFHWTTSTRFVWVSRKSYCLLGIQGQEDCVEFQLLKTNKLVPTYSIFVRIFQGNSLESPEDWMKLNGGRELNFEIFYCTLENVSLKVYFPNTTITTSWH